MKRKDIVLLLDRYFERYPTVAEINYFEHTGVAKETKNFTKEEHELYNPSPRTLEQAYKFMCHILYIWSCKDRVKERLVKDELRIIKEMKAQQDLEKWRAKELERQAYRKIYIAGKGTKLGEEALKRQTAIDNKKRIANVLEYHTRTGIAIPEEMWGVINKYR